MKTLKYFREKCEASRKGNMGFHINFKLISQAFHKHFNTVFYKYLYALR